MPGKQPAVAQQNQSARGNRALVAADVSRRMFRNHGRPPRHLGGYETRGRTEQFYQFIPNPFGADEFDFGRELFDGGKCLRFDFKTQLRGKPHRAQQAQMILGKPFLRRADGADDFRAQILFAADPVVKFFRERIEEKPVDGEIAALRVGLGAG